MPGKSSTIEEKCVGTVNIDGDSVKPAAVTHELEDVWREHGAPAFGREKEIERLHALSHRAIADPRKKVGSSVDLKRVGGAPARHSRPELLSRERGPRHRCAHDRC